MTMNKKDGFIELSCKLNKLFQITKNTMFYQYCLRRINVEHLCLLNRTFPKSLIHKKYSAQSFLGTGIKRMVLSDGGKNYRILKICLFVILFLAYVINEQDTDKIFFLKSGLLNEKCTCLEIILTPSPNINQRLNIFYRIKCAS